MEFHNQVFVTKGLAKEKEKLIKEIKQDKCSRIVYVIALPPNQHQLEIFYFGLTTQLAFSTQGYKIIGLSKSYNDGLELVRKISQLVFDETGDLEFKTYFT